MRNGLGTLTLAVAIPLIGCGGATPDDPTKTEQVHTVTTEWNGHAVASSWYPGSSTATTSLSASAEPGQQLYATVDLERGLFLTPDRTRQLDFAAPSLEGTDALLNALNLAVLNGIVRDASESGDRPGCDMLQEPSVCQVVCCMGEDGCSFQHRCTLESWTSEQGAEACDACNMAFVQCLAGCGAQ